MKYLCVPNFEKWQHYKDRTPPWIKLHRDLLRDYDFSLLPDAAKAHAMLIWLLASQLENHIPDDPAYVQRMIGSASRPDLNLLIRNGFLIRVADCGQDASSPQAERPTLSAAGEAEAETEAEKGGEKTRASKPTLDELSVDHVAAWLAEKRAQGKYAHHDEHFILEFFKNYCQSKGKTYADYVAGYRGAFEWDRCQPKAGGGGQPQHQLRAGPAALGQAGHDRRDPATRARDIGEDIIAKRRAARQSAVGVRPAAGEPRGPGRAHPAPLPDVREPEVVWRQGGDDGVPGRDVPVGPG